MEGIILKAISGFYYVDGGDGVLVACRGRGKFRHQRIIPLVGDKVIFTPLDNGAGILDEILPRRNEFQRPAVANIDQLVVIASGAIVADTPGFSSFDTEEIELRRPEELQYTFREFAPYLEQCRFTGCSHVKEKGCAVLAAVKAGEIAPSRHASYVRLYQQAKEVPEWERK